MTTTSHRQAEFESSANAAGIIAVLVFITCIFCIIWQCCKGDRKSNEETSTTHTARPSATDIGERTPLTRHTSIASNVPTEIPTTGNVGYNPFVINVKSPIEKRYNFASIPYDEEGNHDGTLREDSCPNEGLEEKDVDVSAPFEGPEKPVHDGGIRQDPIYTGEESFPHLLDRLQGSQGNKDEIKKLDQEKLELPSTRDNKTGEEFHSVDETKK